MILQVQILLALSASMEPSRLLETPLVPTVTLLATLVMRVQLTVLFATSTMNQLQEILALLVLSETTVLKATFLVSLVT